MKAKTAVKKGRIGQRFEDRECLGWGSWGNLDEHQLQKDSRRLGIPSRAPLCYSRGSFSRFAMLLR